MASQQLVERLESVAARLERVANRMGGGGDDGGDGPPPYVGEYEQFYQTHVNAVCAAADALSVPEFSSVLQRGYGNVLDLIRATANCSKPNQQGLMAFLQPGIQAIQEADQLKNRRGDHANHLKVLYEMIMAISWVTLAPPNGLPTQHADTQLQACDFNLNRILKACKGQPDQDAQRAFVRACQALNKEHVAYVKANFATGLSYNPQGGPLGDAATGGAPSSAPTAAPEAKEESKEPAPATTTSGGAGGGDMSAVMGQLSQGLAVTSGLKRVTAGMKTKNRTDRSGRVAATKKKAAKKKKPKRGPPQVRFIGGRWMAENFDENPEVVELAEASIRQNVYITTSDRTTFQIPQKVKAVTIDSCNNCRVFVTEVVSTVELVNCKSVTVIVQVKVPSFSVDKCQSPRIILTRESFQEPPEVVTSNISAMNIEIPGVTEDADPVEYPVPEQFLTKIDPETREMTTIEVSHGS